MKNKIPGQLKCAVLSLGALAATTLAYASADYGPAIWNPAYPNHWYTSGNGHKFHVVHDMEGYYLSTISYFKQSGTSASVHYCVNGLKDNSSDAPAGEITQMVLEAYYAWHALCWNTHSTGTEHEGFANNPAWYTEAMYQASAGISRHVADKFGYAKDRNHIVGHNAKSVPGWSAWAGPNLGIDPNCNTHTDPGPNWDWNHYMALINGAVTGSGAFGDFTGNGRTDYVIFRPANGTWYVRDSAGAGNVSSFGFGQGGDIPLIGNWSTPNGAEAALFRPSTGMWYVRFQNGGISSFSFGVAGDVPLIGAWSGQMRDQAVFRPSTGTWFVRFGDSGNTASFSFGQNGDIPLVGNWAGHGMVDQAVFRPSTGTWFVRDGVTGGMSSFGPWGTTGDIPLIGAWSGQMRDQVIFRPSNGTWYIRNGLTGTSVNFVFGQNGDTPMVGNIFGNGMIDQIIYRPSGNWFVRDGNTGTVYTFGFGNAGGDQAVHE
jgi:N-acetylmuramoyl-L-alanine amidase